MKNSAKWGIGIIAAVIIIFGILFATGTLSLQSAVPASQQTPLQQCQAHMNGCTTTAQCASVLTGEGVPADLIPNVIKACQGVGYTVSP